ncbi:MAG: AMP-binding protein, partial [Bifidobacteriaceae bacterium]|nr:AMP-binding protein [Bifidobacteriaceae bacterium]
MDTAALLRRLEAALSGGPPFLAHDADRPAPRPAPPPPPGGQAGAWLALPVGTAVAVPTSGSTGEPQWVALSADALEAGARLSAARLGGTGNWLLALPPTHIAGINVLVRALFAGRAVVGVPPGPFTPEAFAAAAAKLPAGPNFTALVPTQLRRILDGGGDGIGHLRDFVAVLVGGAGLDAALRARAEAAGVRLVATYGMAETCGGCVYDGQPLDSVAVALSGDGVIELSSPTLALGYANAAPGAAGAAGGGPGQRPLG